MRERVVSGGLFLAVAAGGIGALLFFVNQLLRPGDLNSLSLPVVALTAGVASTFNPCGLPAIPGFLTFIGGEGETTVRERSGYCGWAGLGAMSVVLVFGLIVAVAGAGAKGVIAPYFRWVQLSIGIVLVGLAAVHLLGRGERLPLVGAAMVAGSRLWDRSIGRPTARGSYLCSAINPSGRLSLVLVRQSAEHRAADDRT